MGPYKEAIKRRLAEEAPPAPPTFDREHAAVHAARVERARGHVFENVVEIPRESGYPGWSEAGHAEAKRKLAARKAAKADSAPKRTLAPADRVAVVPTPRDPNRSLSGRPRATEDWTRAE